MKKINLFLLILVLVVGSVFAQTTYITDLFINTTGKMIASNATVTEKLNVIGFANITKTIYSGASTSSWPSLNIPNGTAPTNANIGDLWSVSSDNGRLYYQKNMNDTVNLANIPKDIIYINTQADLPEAVEGVITLSPDTTYIFGGPSNLIVLNDSQQLNFSSQTFAEYMFVTTSLPIHFSGGGRITNSIVTYTGNRSMIEGEDIGSGVLRFLRSNFIATNGQIINVSTTHPLGLVIIDNIAVLSAPKGIGKIKGAGVIFDLFRAINFGGGINLEDNLQLAVITNLNFFNGLNNTGTVFINMSGNAGQIVIDRILVSPKSQEKIFYFDPNMTYTGISITNSPIDLTTNPNVNFSNVFENGSLDQSSIGVKAFGNVNIPDSTAVGYMYFNSKNDLTSIPTLSTPVKVNGTWTNKESERFEFNSTGIWNYTGFDATNSEIKATIVLDPQKENADIIFNVYIAKNGVVINDSIDSQEIPAGATATFSPWTKEQIQTGDYFEVYISRETSLDGAYITDARFMIIKT
jgi:hypothetical protein